MIRILRIALVPLTICLLCTPVLAQDTKTGTRAVKKVKAKKKAKKKVRGKKKLPIIKAVLGDKSTDSSSSSSSGSVPGSGSAAAAPAAGDTTQAEMAFNECAKIPRNQRIKVTMKKGVELNELVEFISQYTCKRFIVPDTLRAQKVTIITPRPITVGELFKAFLSMLEVMGLTVTPAGRFLKVVQSNWAIQAPIPTYTHKQRRRLPNSDQVVTQMIEIRHTDVNNMLLVLNKMKSRSGDITAYKPTNLLIITDMAANVRRLVHIIKELDVATEGEKIWVVRLKKADVKDVAKILSQVFAQQRGQIQRRPPIGRPQSKADDIKQYSASKIVSDESSNSLILVSTPTAFHKIISLIKKLDVESESVNQRVHVYYLENADAKDMNTTLGNLTSGGRRGAPARGRRGVRAGTQTATLFEGDVKISADKATNSLVIVATNKDFLNLRKVIRKLDIPRRQVFVECTIMEVTLDKNRDLGFTYHGGGPTGSGDTETYIVGGVQFPPEWSSLMLNPTSLMGLAAGVRGAEIEGSGKLTGFGRDIPGFGVMFKAFQSNNNVHILSSPHILTTDNEKAEILVGTNLPFQGSMMGGMPMMAGAAAGGQNQQLAQMAGMYGGISVQRQDVALKLKLTPHVNDSDMVRLKIEQEIQGVVSKNYNNLGPATSKRSAKTTVVVRDQQTVVIGGLMGNNIRNAVSKVPLLGDIPLLGYFFRYQKKTVERTNLMIVLTPYVIRDQSDLRRIFKKKLEERREFIERFTSFKPGDFDTDIDFRHKRGLLAEISKVAKQAAQEAKILEKAREDTDEKVEPVEMPRGMSSPAQGQQPRIEQQPRHDRAPVSPVQIHPTRAGTIRVR